MTTTDLVEWLNSFTRKASNHQRGFESLNPGVYFYLSRKTDFLLCVCVCVCVCVCFVVVFYHESFIYMTLHI